MQCIDIGRRYFQVTRRHFVMLRPDSFLSSARRMAVWELVRFFLSLASLFSLFFALFFHSACVSGSIWRR